MSTLSVYTTDQLPLMEAFYTLQGEGFHQGKAAYFIRLGGCEVGCVWCDVKESWNPEAHPKYSVEEILAGAQAYPGRLAVITGGEPMMYDLQELTVALQANGFQTNVETAGVYPVTGNWDWICFSPKKFKEPHETIYPVADELKVVIYHPSDIAFAEKHAALVSPDCHLLLQPEWSKQQKILPLLIDYVKSNPQWKVSLQTHKFMQIP